MGVKAKAELSCFIDIAIDSRAETEYFLEFSERLGYLFIEILSILLKGL